MRALQRSLKLPNRQLPLPNTRRRTNQDADPETQPAEKCWAFDSLTLASAQARNWLIFAWQREHTPNDGEAAATFGGFCRTRRVFAANLPQWHARQVQVGVFLGFGESLQFNPATVAHHGLPPA
jgi:hypothetical protein